MIAFLLARMVRVLGTAESVNGRTLACVWGFGATCLTASILLPHPATANDTGLILVVVFAYPAAILMFIHAARLPRGALEAITYVGQLLITALSICWGAPDPPYLWFHVWLVVHTFHFLPPARAMRQTGCAAVLFTVATFVTHSTFPAAAIVVGVGSICAIGMLVGGLRQQVDQLLGALASSASTDPLTGLANRRAYADAYLREQARRLRSGSAGALMVLDCDHFKLLNDRHGHAAGDRALKRVAEIVVANIRDIDTAARLGGDEFSILLHAPQPQAVSEIGERIRRAVAGDGAASVTLSIGIVDLPPGEVIDLTTAIGAADRAMYRSKAHGGNCVSIATAQERTVPAARPAAELAAVGLAPAEPAPIRP